MTSIKFGTDGWRAIIAKEYTVDNVKRVAEGTAKWLKEHQGKRIVIGHDCRFGGRMFAETAAQVLASFGMEVHIGKDFVSTPMVSLGVVKLEADMGIVITASHNPPDYNGYKLKSHFGGPTIPAHIREVEELIPDLPMYKLPAFDDLCKEGLIKEVDLEEMYVQHVEENFDLTAIRSQKTKLAYDAMYGAGQNAVKRLLPGAVFLHCEENPSFMGQAPEPIHRNLRELSETIKNDPSIGVGLANDGDADRIGMYDEDGEFVDSHHLLLLLLYYLHQHKGMKGKVVVTFSVTDKMKRLAERYGLEWEVTPIGFKHIAEIMIKEDVLVGGEESGGLSVKGHIPERDGIWMGLLILEFMAKTGKSLKELIREVYDLVGPFSYDRDDLHIPEEKKQAIIQKCKTDPYTALGEFSVQRVETIDGFKFYLSEEEWVMVRPSGTEPVLRVYAQGETMERVRKILDATHQTLG
jgi:phosphomannomutase